MLLDRVAQIEAKLRERPHLKRLGRLFSETVLLKVDGEEVYLTFEKGELAAVLPGPSRRTPYRFGFVTDREALERFWEPLPAPGFHDLFGLVKMNRARIEGDILALVKNLRFFKEVMALPRGEAVR